MLLRGFMQAVKLLMSLSCMTLQEQTNRRHVTQRYTWDAVLMSCMTCIAA